MVFFLGPTLQVDSTLKIINAYIDLHEDHVLHLRLHLEDLSILYNQTPLKIMTTTLEVFQSQKTNFN